ncbi:MAG: methylated-DNA--[protein]-cysteine S-methyltransferase [Candidatus Thorarchaeota archaeon]|nr:methylated-DNA--[protein]-cysteine S-methyltransferase [Candidatus Thorarchaeota archaeon]
MLYHCIFETAFGHCGIVYRLANEKALAIHIMLPQSKSQLARTLSQRFPSTLTKENSRVEELVRRIQRFFLGDSSRITMDYVDTSVCNKFQLDVLLEERRIPRGMTSSYGRLASEIGTRGIRAVGNALARNPFPVVVPCHRAVRSDRTLGGFQGGLDMKRRILEMEGVRFDSAGRVHAEYFLG